MEYCKKLEVFFGVDPGDFKIIQLPSRSAFDKALGRKTSDWVVGHTKGTDILILDRKKFETESNHKSEEFIQILKHEICHLFTHKLNDRCLVSINEGLSANFSGQDRTAIIKKDNFDEFFGKSCYYNLIPYENFGELQGYQLSYMMTKNILDTFSKDQIIQIIKIRVGDASWKQKIEEITGFSFGEYEKVLQRGILISD